VCTLFLMFAIPMSFTIGKLGGNYNYFLESNLACCPLAGFLLYRGLFCWSDDVRWTEVLTVAYLLPILIMLRSLPDAVKHLSPRTSGEMIEEVKKEETHAAMLQLIKGTQGPVFSEDTMLLYQAGKEVPVELAALATLRMWDAGPLLRMIEERRFPLIVVF